MANAKAILTVVLLTVTILTVACSTATVRPMQLVESSRLRPWMPPPAAPRPAVSPTIEPPPILLALAAPPDRDTTQTVLDQSLRLPLATVRPDPILEQFRAKEVEAWRQTQATVTQQAE